MMIVSTVKRTEIAFYIGTILILALGLVLAVEFRHWYLFLPALPFGIAWAEYCRRARKIARLIETISFTEGDVI